MTEKEKALVKRFLKEHANVIGRRCCNDWDFPEDWTHDEKVQFVREYHEWNGDPEEFDSDWLVLPDFAVVEFLAHRIA